MSSEKTDRYEGTNPRLRNASLWGPSCKELQCTCGPFGAQRSAHLQVCSPRKHAIAVLASRGLHTRMEAWRRLRGSQRSPSQGVVAMAPSLAQGPGTGDRRVGSCRLWTTASKHWPPGQQMKAPPPAPRPGVICRPSEVSTNCQEVLAAGDILFVPASE